VGEHGGNVGPELTHVAKDRSRQELLASIVDPNQTIVKGFESVVVVTDDGRILAGVLQSEDDEVVRFITAEGVTGSIEKAHIDERTTGKSAMPEDVTKFLSKSDIRDLVEYLATLK
jgi:quinoprotein glucose dehydrogenase